MKSTSSPLFIFSLIIYNVKRKYSYYFFKVIFEISASQYYLRYQTALIPIFFLIISDIAFRLILGFSILKYSYKLMTFVCVLILFYISFAYFEKSCRLKICSIISCFTQYFLLIEISYSNTSFFFSVLLDTYLIYLINSSQT